MEMLKTELQAALKRLDSARKILDQSKMMHAAAVSGGMLATAKRCMLNIKRQTAMVLEYENIVRELEKASGAFDFNVTREIDPRVDIAKAKPKQGN